MMNFEILEVVDFTGTDVEYYAKSWQKARYALIKSGSEFIVASMLGEHGWGNGTYFNDNEQGAREYFNECKKYYLG